jgi:plastocyanin
LEPSLTKGRKIVSNRTKKRSIMVASLLTVAVVMLGSAAGRLRAETQSPAPASTELEESRREVRRLREQVQSLRSALNEAAELDRQRLTLINRALKGSASAASAAAAASAAPSLDTPSLRSEPATDAARPRVGSAPPQAPSLPPKRRAAEPTTGIVRGKVELPHGEPVAYVYVENVFAPAVRNEKVVIEQVRKQFVPNWAVIQRGTMVEFPNTDSVYHNVFSQSSGNSFDLGLYNSTSAAKNHTFSEPGAVDIFCNIHPQMAASILVVPNRHFAKVKPDGKFEIGDVPAGKRKVVAWAPGSRLNVQWVELGGGDSVDVDFRLEGKLPGHKNKDGQQYGSYQ